MCVFARDYRFFFLLFVRRFGIRRRQGEKINECYRNVPWYEEEKKNRRSPFLGIKYKTKYIVETFQNGRHRKRRSRRRLSFLLQ